jgi:hypothetical protein
MNEFFAKNYVIGFHLNLREALPPLPAVEGREGILTRDLMNIQDGKTMFFEEDILPGQCDDFCPVNMMAFEKEIFGLVRVADLLPGLAVLKEEFKFCGVLAVSHLAWFDASESKWRTEHPKDEAIPFERRIEDVKSWPRPVPLSVLKSLGRDVTVFSGPRLLREFFDYLDSPPLQGVDMGPKKS